MIKRFLRDLIIMQVILSGFLLYSVLDYAIGPRLLGLNVEIFLCGILFFHSIFIYLLFTRAE
ncbi:hypothetical protein DRO26_01545 [Candidatus Bathyarchaeota archaeon]|nr:MAG: hypothetical protein DRO26_01545 [Candidatus Bathyarchaeota archaeon]